MSEPNELIPTRRSLLSRLKSQNDQESWKAFFDTYWKLIYNAAIRAGLTPVEAQDVVQDTVIAVSKKIPQFDAAKGSFKTWLMRQTGWRIQGQYRKRMPHELRRFHDETATGTATINRIPDQNISALDTLWDEEWERNLIEAGMHRVKARVDGKQYQVFDLCVIKKWPISKIAHDLKISAARIYLIRHRIGKLVKKEIEYLKTKYV
jgi:RNA polymerase sigma-70 factor (ECF subfamily)